VPIVDDPRWYRVSVRKNSERKFFELFRELRDSSASCSTGERWGEVIDDSYYPTLSFVKIGSKAQGKALQLATKPMLPGLVYLKTKMSPDIADDVEVMQGVYGFTKNVDGLIVPLTESESEQVESMIRKKPATLDPDMARMKKDEYVSIVSGNHQGRYGILMGTKNGRLEVCLRSDYKDEWDLFEPDQCRYLENPPETKWMDMSAKEAVESLMAKDPKNPTIRALRSQGLLEEILYPMGPEGDGDGDGDDMERGGGGGGGGGRGGREGNGGSYEEWGDGAGSWGDFPPQSQQSQSPGVNAGKTWTSSSQRGTGAPGAGSASFGDQWSGPTWDEQDGSGSGSGTGVYDPDQRRSWEPAGYSKSESENGRVPPPTPTIGKNAGKKWIPNAGIRDSESEWGGGGGGAYGYDGGGFESSHRDGQSRQPNSRADAESNFDDFIHDLLEGFETEKSGGGSGDKAGRVNSRELGWAASGSGFNDAWLDNSSGSGSGSGGGAVETTAALDGYLDDLAAQPSTPLGAKGALATSSSAPSMDDFGSFEEYLDALVLFERDAAPPIPGEVKATQRTAAPSQPYWSASPAESLDLGARKSGGSSSGSSSRSSTRRRILDTDEDDIEEELMNLLGDDWPKPVGRSIERSAAEHASQRTNSAETETQRLPTATAAGGPEQVSAVAMPPDKDLSSLKVADLKALLKARNLPVSGTKGVLIERLQQAESE
jgi:transcription antitermination factor NusG